MRADVSPGDNLQLAVDQHAPGTVFVMAGGTYANQQVVPKEAQSFLANTGATMDGGGVTPFAFHGTASRVTIRGLIIQNYIPTIQRGAIHAQNGDDGNDLGDGWVVDNCELTANLHYGLRLGHNMAVTGCNIHHNGQLGIGGTGDYCLVEDNEIAYNNTGGFDPEDEAGGSKFSNTTGLRVRGNYVHHNIGPGLWTDIDNTDTIYENNLVQLNTWAGIHHEISYSCIIRYNTLTGNGTFDKGWLWNGGVSVSTSSDVEVYGNTVTGNRNGIAGLQQNRGSGAFGTYRTANLYVHDNLVTNSGTTGLVQDNGDATIFTTRNNRWVNNDYVTPAFFDWGNGLKTWAQWQGLGQDLTGSFT